MMQLSAKLFGTFAITFNNKPLTNFYSDKVRALLAYLLVENEQAHTRDKLAGLLWPDSPNKQARQSLRQALLHLRKTLNVPEQATPFILADRRTIQLNPEASFITDVEQFEKAIGQPNGAVSAINLYRGDFLDGFFLPDSADFDDWVLIQREMLRSDMLAALHLQAHKFMQKGAFAQAVKIGQQWLQLEPWQEEAHRVLIRAFFAQGEQALALAQFEACSQTLQAELGIEPTAETQALCDEIRLSSKNGRSNLPAPTTPFIGRQTEQNEIVRQLNDPTCRLLTIVGAGGSGKTRLAIAAAAQISLPHGVLFVGLDGLSDANRLPLLIADLLGMAPQPTLPIDQQLINFLEDRQLLLLLDNVEPLLIGTQAHVVRQFLVDLLAGSPQVKLLATSRVRLQLHAEWAFPLGGMMLPKEADSLSENEAIQLFVQCAQRVNPDFGLTGENGRFLAQICALCAGLPLALELAASWLHVLNCAEIAIELTTSLDLLSTSQPDVPARQQSLTAVFTQSWLQLTSAEQQALRRLAIFHGGFDRAAAKEIANISFPQLATLSEKSLIQRIVSPGQPRFSLHKPLRLFANTKLSEAGEQQQLAKQHQTYYLYFLSQRQTLLESDGQRRALNEISRDLDNVRAAWQHAIQQQDVAALNQAVAALYYFYDTRSWFQEGATMFAAAANIAKERNHQAWARISSRHAWFTFHLGERTAAPQRFRATLAQFGDDAQEPAMLYPICFLAAVYLRTGQFTQAKETIEQALSVAHALDDSFYAGIAHNILGQILKEEGKFRAAQHEHERTLYLTTLTGNQLTRAFAFTFLGEIAIKLEEFERAEELFRQSLAVRRTLDDRRGMAFNSLMLGDVAQQSDEETAVSAYQTSLQAYHEIGDRWGMTEAHLRLAQQTAVFDHAASHLREALQLILRTKSLAQLQQVMSLLHAHQGISDAELAEVIAASQFQAAQPIAEQAVASLLSMTNNHYSSL